jgi:hypothetical protein
MRIRQRASAAAAITVLVGTAAIVPTTPAFAAGSCSAGPRRTDFTNRSYNTKYCPTWLQVEVTIDLLASADGGLRVGVLDGGTSWFVCQSVGADNPRHGGNQNRWWLYTKADRAVGPAWRQGWGWIPATAVSYGGDKEPIPGLQACYDYPGYNPGG